MIPLWKQVFRSLAGAMYFGMTPQDVVIVMFFSEDDARSDDENFGNH